MRLDAYDPADREFCLRAEVFLNGEKRPHVIMADEERGEIKEYVTDGLGFFLVDSTGCDLQTRMAYGEVKINLRKL